MVEGNLGSAGRVAAKRHKDAQKPEHTENVEWNLHFP
jgi:hypothetical protein